MAIRAVGACKLHWNYFLALESDLVTVSRYIEFSRRNLKVYSIELAHLLFAAASEVDVLAKSVCTSLDPNFNGRTINDYHRVLTNTHNTPAGLKRVTRLTIDVPRYGLRFVPWSNWKRAANPPVHPDWWTSYNKVKHQRDTHFPQATLKNALNALGALLILNLYYYRMDIEPNKTTMLEPKNVMRDLEPQSILLKLPSKYYDGFLIV